MRAIRLFLMLLPALMLSLGGCGDDFLSGLPGLRQVLVGRGTAYGVRWLDSVARGLEDVAAATGQYPNLPPNVEYDPTTGAFTVDIDTSKDGVADSTLRGVLASSSDLSNGIDPGETATADWVLLGDVSGVGTLRYLGLARNLYACTGSASFTDGIEFDFDANSIDINLDDSDYPLDGTIDYETFARGVSVDPLDEDLDIEEARMDGILEFFGTERATGTGEFDGEDLIFDVKLDTYQVVFTL